MANWSALYGVPAHIRKGSTLYHVMSVDKNWTHGHGYHDNYTEAEKAWKQAKRDGYEPFMFTISHPLEEGGKISVDIEVAQPKAQGHPKAVEILSQGELPVLNFRYNVVYTPIRTFEEAQTGVMPKPIVLVPATDVMAANEAVVRMIAAKQIDAKYDDKLEQVVINVKAGL